MELFLQNETSELESVVLGIGIDRGQPRLINPTMRKHAQNHTSPSEETIQTEIQTFEEVLIQNGVHVLRPQNLRQTEQIFTRDIGFVIEDNFFISNMKHPVRASEIDGLQYFLDTIPHDKIVEIPPEITMEGGDVILWNDFIFLGIGDRTNEGAISFLQKRFPQKTVLGFPIVVDQACADKNILHLDCTFQPIGQEDAIIYLKGFQSPPSELLDLFPKDKLMEVSLEEKNQMFPNVFSISPRKVAIEKGFVRLKDTLIERGYEIFEVEYAETSKLGGLLRCSTLPLRRKAG